MRRGGLGRLFPVLKREGEGKGVDYGTAERRAGRGDALKEKSGLGREVRGEDLLGEDGKGEKRVKSGGKEMEELEEGLHFAMIVEG